jgi:pimeloyl-ACP methyl ester carboxylesterase
MISQPIEWRSFGTGPRKVLAIHCTIAHSGAWRGLAGQLADECTFIAPDMLSHGRSPDWDRQGDVQDRNVEAIRPLLNEPMDVVGHSFGAMVALRFAVENPDMVRSVTMIEPVYFAVAFEDDPDVVAAHVASERPVYDAFEAGDEPLAARLFNRRWGGDAGPRWPDLPEATRAAMIRGIHYVPASRGAVFDDHPGMLRHGVLDRVTMPVLLMRGDPGEKIIQVVNDGLARRLPNATNVAVPGAGHMLPLTHPAETAAHLRALFKRAPV